MSRKSQARWAFATFPLRRLRQSYSRIKARLSAHAHPGDEKMTHILVALVLALFAGNAIAQLKIVTASARGTYIILGRDLATHVAPDAGFDLEALESAGSVENVTRLRFEPGVKFAIVQSDVFQSYVDMAKAGNKGAANLIKPIRVILPLYNEEVYFIVRADSPLNFVNEIRDSKINAGPNGSGTALTTLTMYRAMFEKELPATTTYLPNEEALVKLTTDKSVDVVAVVGGQPMKLLADMKPEAKQLIRILKFDPTSVQSKPLLRTYFAVPIKQASYPNLLDADQPGISVKAYLVTYDFYLGQTQGMLRKFARSLCANFDKLQKFGHPKWKEVSLNLTELGEGWQYYPTTAEELRSCTATKEPPKPVKPACSQQETILGLCGPTSKPK